MDALISVEDDENNDLGSGQLLRSTSDEKKNDDDIYFTLLLLLFTYLPYYLICFDVVKFAATHLQNMGVGIAL